MKFENITLGVLHQNNNYHKHERNYTVHNLFLELRLLNNSTKTTNITYFTNLEKKLNANTCIDKNIIFSQGQRVLLCTYTAFRILLWLHWAMNLCSSFNVNIMIMIK